MKDTIMNIMNTRNITIGISLGLYAVLIYIMFVGYFVAVPPIWWSI